MARVRCITEMGMGVDVHGKDATKAAKRAVSDAIRHSSLGFFRMLGKTAQDMFVEVTIGVPDPSGVDTSCATPMARVPRAAARVAEANRSFCSARVAATASSRSRSSSFL